MLYPAELRKHIQLHYRGSNNFSVSDRTCQADSGRRAKLNAGARAASEARAELTDSRGVCMIMEQAV